MVVSLVGILGDFVRVEVLADGILVGELAKRVCALEASLEVLPRGLVVEVLLIFYLHFCEGHVVWIVYVDV